MISPTLYVFSWHSFYPSKSDSMSMHIAQESIGCLCDRLGFESTRHHGSLLEVFASGLISPFIIAAANSAETAWSER